MSAFRAQISGRCRGGIGVLIPQRILPGSSYIKRMATVKGRILSNFSNFSNKQPEGLVVWFDIPFDSPRREESIGI